MLVFRLEDLLLFITSVRTIFYIHFAEFALFACENMTVQVVKINLSIPILYLSTEEVEIHKNSVEW